MKRILGFLRPYRIRMAVTLAVMVLDVAGGLLIPTITANIINYGVAGGDMDYILRQGLLMTVVALVTSGGALAGSYLCADLAARLGADIRDALYDRSLELSAADIEGIGTASMITRTLSDVNVVQQSLVMFIQMILPVPAVCIMGIVMAFRINGKMGWILTGVTSAILLMAVLVMRYAAPLFERLQQYLDRMNVVIRENVTGVRVIRAFGKERYEEQRLRGVFADYEEVSIRVNRLFAGLDCTALLVINLVIVVILYVGGGQVGAGSMRIGDITALTEYAIMILFYVIMAQMVMIMLPRAVVCARRIRQVLDTAPGITDGSGSLADGGAAGDVVLEFCQAGFRFADADEETLSDLNFACRRGQTTAIIGSTGSGKSTIAKLALRFHDATRGSVRFCGSDLRDIAQQQLRRHIAYVPQKAWLFSGTIAENLRYGDDTAGEAAMWHALEVAQAGFVQDLPQGLQSRVAQGGTNFSGGQRQRLSIARALMKRADLYIFDDSFSALDYRTDAALRHALTAETRDAAVLIIAQRISTILGADQIIVLEDGRVAGTGTHPWLMENCPVYREIAQSQMKGGEQDG